MRMQTLSVIAAACATQLAFVSPARADEANLVGVFDLLSAGFGLPTSSGVNIIFFYGELNAEVGMNMADISADGMLGGTGADQSGSTEFIHYDASNSHNFARFVEHLTNGVDEEMWGCAIVHDANGTITFVGTQHQYLEEFGIASRFSDGAITFAKYVVGMSAGSGGAFNTLQFFSGDPKIDGGAQSADVDQFITFAWPLEKTTNWYWGSKGTLGLTITYGPTINPATFQATLNREPLTGFHPVPGTTEVVYVPITAGRSTLVISVEGTKPSGGAATDTDRLTVIGI